MRKAVRYLVTRFYKPLLVKYLGKTRPYSYRGIRLLVPPARLGIAMHGNQSQSYGKEFHF